MKQRQDRDKTKTRKDKDEIKTLKARGEMLPSLPLIRAGLKLTDPPNPMRPWISLPL